MLKKVTPLALVAVVALALVAVAGAAPRGMGWSAKLDAMQEIPKQAVHVPNAKGSFHATLTGTTLKWKLTYSGLSGPALAAHIHMAAMGKSGNVVVALCGPCKAGGVSGSAKVSKAVIKAADKHLLYVNVHTKKNPNGEIRGQITP
jgi:CHRD domain